MFPHMLRLNVGQVEVLTLTSEQARFVFHFPLSQEDASPGEFEIGTEPYYAAVPVPSSVCTIAMNDLPALSSAVRHAHNAYIRAATSFKRRSPFRKSFSPAVLEYLEVVLGISSPRPSYLPEQTIPRVTPLADELNDLMPITEGAKYQAIVNSYERNPIAGSRCIGHYGPTCVVCGFNFGAVYGPSRRRVHPRPPHQAVIGDWGEVRG
jgi:5-methylcytosine-specific restriction protein A